jgi:Mg2+-importing ATPase
MHHSAPLGPEPEEEVVAALSRLDPESCCARVRSRLTGLSPEEAAERLETYGPNLVTREARVTILQELWSRARNPLNGLLLTLAVLSYLLGDTRAAVVITVIVLLAVVTAFVQEHRSNEAAAQLRAMVRTTAAVRRQGGVDFVEVPIETLVPGDIVRLSAGDMIPADIRLLETKDLFINQSALTGEAMPAEKFGQACETAVGDPFDLPNMCFMGANVVSGYATGVVVRTGGATFFGQLADEIASRRVPTAFDRGIDRFTWLMMKFMLVMMPSVFLINGLTKHDWLEALLFAVAVAVGLTPEMLPMIVTVNLAKGAIAMAREKVIVKRLQSIQNFGAMNVLCADKTGTLTQDRIILKRHLDIRGEESERVLQYAYLNSHFQSGLKNLLDVAVLEHVEMHKVLGIDEGFAKVDEVPFDFVRRRLSVVVSDKDGKRVLICKGAVEEIFAVCTHYEVEGERGVLDPSHFATAQEETIALNSDGFRVVAVAYKELPRERAVYSMADECDLTLLGYIAFLDPPKESAGEAIAALARKGVAVKILTGDNEVITRKVCRDVGLHAGDILLGARIETMSDAELADASDRTTVFAKLTPAQKEESSAPCAGRAMWSGFSATASTTARRSKPPMSASPSTAPSISPRSRPISFSSRRASWCCRKGSSRVVRCSATSPST